MRMNHVDDVDLFGRIYALCIGEGKVYVLDESGQVVGEGWTRPAAELDAIRNLAGLDPR